MLIVCDSKNKKVDISISIFKVLKELYTIFYLSSDCGIVILTFALCSPALRC